MGRVQRWVLLFTVALAVGQPATAEGWDATIEQPTPVPAWREISGGGIATLNGWSLYSSSTFAPFGDLASDGFRMRIGSGYGRYQYTKPARFYYTCPKPTLICPAGHVTGRVTFGDILAGYQYSIGPMTVKAFAGFATDTQTLSRPDSFNESAGAATGFKGALEVWLNMTPKSWAAFDGSWTAAHDGYAAKVRVGYRLIDAVSVGLQEEVAGNIGGRRYNSGAFVRYEWSWGEAAISGGVATETANFRDISRDQLWTSVNVSVRY